MGTYLVNVREYSDGVIAIDSDSDDAAMEVARDTLNNNVYSQVRVMRQILDVTPFPDTVDSSSLVADTTDLTSETPADVPDVSPEEVQLQSATDAALAVLAASKT